MFRLDLRKNSRPLAALIIVGVLVVGQPLWAASSAVVNVTASIAVCGNNIREEGEQCDNDDLGGETCDAIGFSGGFLGCMPSCEYQVDTCQTDADAFGIPLFTSDIGGEYTLGNDDEGVTIDLPDHFYTEDLQLDLFADTPEADDEIGAPSGKSIVGNVYDFFFIDPNGDVVSILTKPTTITISYTHGDLSGLDENLLAPYHRERGASEWLPVANSTIDTTLNTVTFSTNTFSSFALFSAPLAVSMTPSGSGSGGTVTGIFIIVTPTMTPAQTFLPPAFPQLPISTPKIDIPTTTSEAPRVKIVHVPILEKTIPTPSQLSEPKGKVQIRTMPYPTFAETLFRESRIARLQFSFIHGISLLYKGINHFRRALSSLSF